jgi:hypothetical protein
VVEPVETHQRVLLQDVSPTQTVGRFVEVETLNQILAYKLGMPRQYHQQGENAMEQSLPMNVEKLLQDLQSKDDYIRKTAAEEMGKSNAPADDRVLSALKAVAETDSNKYVRSAATQSCLALGGQAMQLPQEAEPHTPSEVLPLGPRKHSGCLTAFLALAVVGNALLALVTWSMASDVPSSMQPLVIFSGLLNLAGVGFAIAVYKWKKWGVYGYVTVLGIIILLNLELGDIASALRGLIPLGLLLSLIGSSWKQME